MALQFSASNDVRHTVVDGVLWVEIDRPEKRNPLSLGVLDSIRSIFKDAAQEPSIRVAVITGAGEKAFAAGGDLSELAGYRSPEEAAAFSRHGKAALDEIRRFPVPVVARVNGVALGGGAELAMACDLRYAARSAKLGFIHGDLAISPSWGGGYDLVRLLGPAKALRLMTTAAVLNAEEAKAAGVFDDVCPEDASFERWFDDQLSLLRRRPPQVMRAFKAIAVAASLDRARADNVETDRFAEAWAHEDHWSAVSALGRKAQ